MRTGCQLGWILASKIHQNLHLDGSWAVLWPSWVVLGRLGGLLRRVGGFLRRLGASWALLIFPEAAKSSKNRFSVGFKEPERGGIHGTGTTGDSMYPPQKGIFQRQNHQPLTRTRVLSSGHKTQGRLVTPSRKARWRIFSEIYFQK